MPSGPKSLPGLPADYTPKFFHGDVVVKYTDANYRARVLRCWMDEEDLPPSEQGPHPLDRSLLRGEVGIADMTLSALSIVPESSLILFQREFLKGDIVKRSLTAIESAVVMGSESEVQLEHAITGKKVKGWIPWSRLRTGMVMEARDRVVYGNWIGTVEEVFEIAKVNAWYDGYSYTIRGSGGSLEVGRTVRTAYPGQEPLPNLPPNAKPDSDVITAVYPEVVFVTWNAINQELPVTEQDKYPEPPRFWRGSDIEKLTLYDSTQNAPIQIGVCARFIDPDDPVNVSAPGWNPLHSLFPVSPFEQEVKVYRVIETRTKMRLRWQDAKETEEWANSLVPYRNVDDYETWPGEHLVWRDEEGQRRPVCIQSFNPHQRVADISFLDDQTKSTVSVLELDTGGPGKANYGVGVGQQVLFCMDNGSPLPEVPTLGETGPPSNEFEAELHRLSESHKGCSISASELKPHIPSGDLGVVKWWGEVIDLHPDGTVSVRTPPGEIRRVGIKQLILLNDPLGGDIMDAFPGLDDMEPEHDLPPTLQQAIEVVFGGDPEAFEAFEDEYLGREGSWEDMDEDEDERYMPNGVEVVDIDLAESERDVEEVDPMIIEEPEPERSSSPTANQIRVQHDEGTPEAGPSSPMKRNGKERSRLAGHEHWQSFDMLDSAPEDHHFFSEPRTSAAKAYNTRLQKEHRTLMTSLPENILVRTYEDRTDLMRVLIVGPEGTPYNDAPFVFDVYLPPSRFPNDPPLVYFHSHTNGHGRCNPNLYEDGKVCLSILGTWDGDSTESWNAQTSSLLQVFVSISGLVLVRHPYHCEPAFAKLEGTREGRINSRLYSEKAYVLSRSFVRQALLHPPSGLEKELQYFYIAQGRLRSVIDHARRLMEKGEAAAEGGSPDADKMEAVEEDEEVWSEDAMGSLSMGAILTLKRTIGALESIQISS